MMWGDRVQDLCEILTALQQDAPQHSYWETRNQVHLCFGLPIEAIFVSFEEQPLASASIAQVSAATLDASQACSVCKSMYTVGWLAVLHTSRKNKGERSKAQILRILEA